MSRFRSRPGKHAPYLLAAMLAFSTPAMAVLPDEILPDPALEARARAISAEVRCPVCQGENIDDSSAPISRDLRIIIRERLVAGDTDAEVLDFLVARYGEFVLFNPRPSGSNLILWASGPVLLLLGLGLAAVVIRRRGTETGLTPEEAARLDEVLRRDA